MLSDDNYQYALRVWDDFLTENVHLKNDTFSLPDVFEDFKHKC